MITALEKATQPQTIWLRWSFLDFELSMSFKVKWPRSVLLSVLLSFLLGLSCCLSSCLSFSVCPPVCSPHRFVLLSLPSSVCPPVCPSQSVLYGLSSSVCPLGLSSCLSSRSVLLSVLVGLSLSVCPPLSVLLFVLLSVLSVCPHHSLLIGLSSSVCPIGSVLSVLILICPPVCPPLSVLPSSCVLLALASCLSSYLLSPSCSVCPSLSVGPSLQRGTDVFPWLDAGTLALRTSLLVVTDFLCSSTPRSSGEPVLHHTLGV